MLPGPFPFLLPLQAREQLVSQNTALEGVKAELKAAHDSKAALQVGTLSTRASSWSFRHTQHTNIKLVK